MKWKIIYRAHIDSNKILIAVSKNVMQFILRQPTANETVQHVRPLYTFTETNIILSKVARYLFLLLMNGMKQFGLLFLLKKENKIDRDRAKQSDTIEQFKARI